MNAIDRMMASRNRFGAEVTGKYAVIRVRQLVLVFLAFFAVALLFHANGLNIFRDLVGAGDGYTAGLPSKLFATHLSPWNPYVQLGQYSFANTQFQPFYPPALLIMM